MIKAGMTVLALIFRGPNCTNPTAFKCKTTVMISLSFHKCRSASVKRNIQDLNAVYHKHLQIDFLNRKRFNPDYKMGILHAAMSLPHSANYESDISAQALTKACEFLATNMPSAKFNNFHIRSVKMCQASN